MASTRSVTVDTDAIMRNILVIRGQRALLDSELAALYQVATKALTRAVRRNPRRFPADFMFQLAVEESASLRSQSGALKTGRGKYRKYAPYVFTEQGIAMLSSVLTSERAVQVNIEIMRAFIRLRQAVSTHQDLAHKLAALAPPFPEGTAPHRTAAGFEPTSLSTRVTPRDSSSPNAHFSELGQSSRHSLVSSAPLLLHIACADRIALATVYLAKMCR